jgi:hypothetical protein
LHFKGAFINTTIDNSIKAWPALVEERRRREVRITRVNGRAARQQRVRECRPAIILQWAEYRIGIDLVAGSSQKTAAIIAAEVVTERCHCALFVVDVGACSSLQDRVRYV